MFDPSLRAVTTLDLLAARRRATDYLPFSPAWDAAVARVEDLERFLWLVDRASTEPAQSDRTLTVAAVRLAAAPS